MPAPASTEVTWPDFLSLIKAEGYSGKGDDLVEVKTWLKGNGFSPDEMELDDGSIKIDELWKSRPGRKLSAKPAVEAAQRRKERQEDLDATLAALGIDRQVEKARTNGDKDHSAAISVRDNVEDDPTLGYGKYEADGLGHMMLDVAKATRMAQQGSISQMPERLVKSQKIMVDRLVKAGQGMNEAVDADGGFLAMPEHTNQLLRKIYDTAVFAPRCRVVNMNKRQITIPYVVESSRADGSRHGGVQGYWQAEGAGKTVSQPSLGRLTLTAHKLYAYSFVTDELQEDGDPGALQLLSELFTEELAFKLDDSFINGTGAGQPLGIVNSPAFAQVTRVAVDVISGADLTTAWMRMPIQNRKTAVWLIAQDAESALYQAAIAPVPAGAGFNQLLWNPMGSASNSLGFNTLGGRPVLPMEQIPQLTAPNSVLFVDPQAYLYGRRRGVESATSIHVSFATDETAFKMTMRADGQPWWDSALTPFSGSTQTLTPFLGNTT